MWLNFHSTASSSPASTCQDQLCSDSVLGALSVQELTITIRVVGVFDGHGIQGRNAARIATESILKHLEADSRSAASSLANEWDRIFEDACVQVSASSLN